MNQDSPQLVIKNYDPRFQSFSLKVCAFLSAIMCIHSYLHHLHQMNDTLDDAMCPNADSSDAQKTIWTSIFGGLVADRLNLQAPGANLTSADISNLIPLCAFETLATEVPSPFCSLFSAQEFAHFEYFSDLDKYYGTGCVFVLWKLSQVKLTDTMLGMDNPLVRFKVSAMLTNFLHGSRELRCAITHKRIGR